MFAHSGGSRQNDPPAKGGGFGGGFTFGTHCAQSTTPAFGAGVGAAASAPAAAGGGWRTSPPNLASSIGAAAPAFGGVFDSGVPQRKMVKVKRSLQPKRSPLDLEVSDRLARGGGGFTVGTAAFGAGVGAAAKGGSGITGRIERATMPTGVVCNTNPLEEKGYGFITPDNGTNYIIIIPCIGGSEE
jgi:hypothetical protein